MIKNIIAISFLFLLTGCPTGMIAHEKYKTCEGYDRYLNSAKALRSAESKLISLNNSSGRAIPEAVTVTEGNVTKTFLVNPLDDDIERVREEVGNLKYEVEEFKKKCSLYKW